MSHPKFKYATDDTDQHGFRREFPETRLEKRPTLCMGWSFECKSVKHSPAPHAVEVSVAKNWKE